MPLSGHFLCRARRPGAPFPKRRTKTAAGRGRPALHTRTGVVPADRPGGRSLRTRTDVVPTEQADMNGCSPTGRGKPLPYRGNQVQFQIYEEPRRKAAEVRAGRGEGRSSPRRAPTDQQGVSIVAWNYADRKHSLTAPSALFLSTGRDALLFGKAKRREGRKRTPRPARAGEILSGWPPGRAPDCPLSSASGTGRYTCRWPPGPPGPPPSAPCRSRRSGRCR